MTNKVLAPKSNIYQNGSSNGLFPTFFETKKVLWKENKEYKVLSDIERVDVGQSVECFKDCVQVEHEPIGDDGGHFGSVSYLPFFDLQLFFGNVN